MPPIRAPEHAARLAGELFDQLAFSGPRDAPVTDVDPEQDWVASGGARLTGAPGGPRMSVPGAPASALRGALAVLAAAVNRPPTALPGVELIGERALLTGLRRNGPWSCGGKFRGVRAGDGWVGLSLARAEDLTAVLALVSTRDIDDPWTAVAEWAAVRCADEVVERARLLDLPAAVIPASPRPERRPPVLIEALGERRGRDRAARVVDLSALWAGPLCARLLRAAGAEVITVENTARPDPGGWATPAFYDRLHQGCTLRRIDFDRDSAQLADLVAGADVIITASRARALSRLDLDPDGEVARGAVWVHISAYGMHTGDDSGRVGFGDDVAAGAGLVTWSRNGRATTPLPVADAVADPLAGAFAAAAAATVLRTGRGAFLDVSMHDVSRRAAADARAHLAR